MMRSAVASSQLVCQILLTERSFLIQLSSNSDRLARRPNGYIGAELEMNGGIKTFRYALVR